MVGTFVYVSWLRMNSMLK
uniref:Uncharacterized protein n=1 Tax=Arundo donax TaxID=35708 RepID=A0A0A8YCP4_ARUDO